MAYASTNNHLIASLRVHGARHTTTPKDYRVFVEALEYLA